MYGQMAFVPAPPAPRLQTAYAGEWASKRRLKAPGSPRSRSAGQLVPSLQQLQQQQSVTIIPGKALYTAITSKRIEQVPLYLLKLCILSGTTMLEKFEHQCHNSYHFFAEA